MPQRVVPATFGFLHCLVADHSDRLTQSFYALILQKQSLPELSAYEKDIRKLAAGVRSPFLSLACLS